MSICRNLNVGLLFPFRNPPAWRKPFADFYADHLAQTRLAEDLGYDEIWLTEHHFAEDGYSPAILPIASAIAAVTKRIRIGTYLVLLPLHNAVRVAEDAATIDIISNGRFDLGLGQGYAPGEFAAYGVDRKTRAGRLEEGIEVIRGAWTNDDFSFEGQHYKLKNIRLVPARRKRSNARAEWDAISWALRIPQRRTHMTMPCGKPAAIQKISLQRNFISATSRAPMTRRGRIRRTISTT
jgi:Luciferase-like monooxygenase